MAIQKKYRNISEVNLASYDFYDLFTGTGYKNFYLADAIIDSTDTKILTISQFYSDTGYTASTDMDFDITMAVPITINGDCVFNLFAANSGTSANVAFTIKFYKVNAASVETQIGSTTTITKSFDNSTNILSGKATLPNTRIGAGEKLRLNIGSSNGAVRIMHDPKGRDTSATPASFITSASFINLPIKL